MDLDLQVGRQGQTTVVAVGGDVDLSSATQLRSCLDDVIDAGSSRIVMDLSHLTFMDCAGLDALVEVARRMPMPIALARPPSLVDEMLAILEVRPLLPTFPTVQQACAAQAS